jgi:hypothetical protein
VKLQTQSFITSKNIYEIELKGGDEMTDSEDPLSQILKGTITDIMPHKDLVIEAVHDLVRDEIKKYIRQKLDEDPELKKEIKEAINDYLTAKVSEVNATLRLAKAGGKLGLNLIPDHLRAEVTKDIASILEKEIGDILEKGM